MLLVQIKPLFNDTVIKAYIFFLRNLVLAMNVWDPSFFCLSEEGVLVAGMAKCKEK